MGGGRLFEAFLMGHGEESGLTLEKPLRDSNRGMTESNIHLLYPFYR